MRIDTTVVKAPIHYPTDSGLCEDAVRMVRRQLLRLAAAGVNLGFKLRDVKRSVGRRMREIGQALRLRGDRAREAIKKPYRRLLRITARFVRHGEKAVNGARRQLKALPRKMRRIAERALAKLAAVVPLARRVVWQTRARIMRGITDSGEKLISLTEPYAQILRRGKIHKPTEFGMLVKVQEAEGGLVTDIGLVPEKADAPLLVPAGKRHVAVFGRAPRMTATDRGFFSTEGERELKKMGVRHVVLPKPGGRSRKRIEYEQQRWFRRGRAWRAGGEARIARLKHRFGMARSRYRGQRGMERTVLWAAISNNLVAVARGNA
jgi:transposase, IS5 family